MALTDKLTAIADAIRGKNGETRQYTLDEMPSAIGEISGGNEGDTFEEYLTGGFESYSNSNITSIGDHKFYNDKTIKNINLPNCVSVGGYFLYNSNVESINLPKIRKIGKYFLTSSKIKEFESEIEEIRDYFNDNSDGMGNILSNIGTLTKIYLPNVTFVGTDCFSNLTSLVDIYMPKVEWISQGCFNGFNIETIDDNMFPCLKRIGYWRNQTTASSSNSFYYSDKIKRINLTNLIYIKEAFNYCSNLEEVLLPNLESIVSTSFNNCNKIKKLSFPKLTYIYLSSSIMSGLEYLDCGVVKNFDVNCKNFPKIKTIILRKEDSIATYGKSSSYDPKTTDYSIYVPRALIETYKTANNWSRMADHFVALEDYTDDGTCSGNFVEGGRKIVSSEGSVLTISNVPDITNIEQDGTRLVLS